MGVIDDMSIHIEHIDTDPIVVITFQAPISMPDDPMKALEAGAKLKHKVGGRICRILDFSNVQLNFSDMMLGMSFEKNQEGGTYDPDVANIFIGSDDLVKFGVESLSSQEHYKGANVKGLFTSRDEAIAKAREILSENNA
jgi:hypothetical protein